MTNEERDVITRFIERVGGAGGSGFGSVPSTGQAPGSQGLPPVDHEADGLIGELFGKYPEARYRITQLAYVQEQALNAAQRRMQAMQQQLQQLQSQQGGGGQGPSPWGQGPQSQQQAQPQSRGFLSGLFGGNRASAPPPPPPQAYQAPPQQYAQPQYAPPAMMQQQGSGFLGGALRTAAGVAGGLVAGQALMNLFEGGGRGLFGGASEPAIGAPARFGGGFAGGGDPGWVGSPDASPVSDAFAPGFAPDPMDQGGALKSDPGSDPYAAGQGAWQQADAGGGGWQDAPPDQGGGWQDAGAVDQGGADQGGGLQGGWDDAAGGGGDGGWTDSSSDA
jgi:hypothetical protein